MDTVEYWWIYVASSVHKFLLVCQPNLTTISSLPYNAGKRGFVGMQKEWYSVKELAEEWGLEEETIRQYIRTKQLEAVRFGNTYRIPKDAIQKFIDKRRTTKDDTQ